MLVLVEIRLSFHTIMSNLNICLYLVWTGPIPISQSWKEENTIHFFPWQVLAKTTKLNVRWNESCESTKSWTSLFNQCHIKPYGKYWSSKHNFSCEFGLNSNRKLQQMKDTVQESGWQTSWSCYINKHKQVVLLLLQIFTSTVLRVLLTWHGRRQQNFSPLSHEEPSTVLNTDPRPSTLTSYRSFKEAKSKT